MDEYQRKGADIVFPPKPDGFEQNPGSQPRRTRGKRVEALLMNGMTGTSAAGAAKGWPADTCNWKISDSPFAIAHYRVL